MIGANTVTLCGRALERPGHLCAFFDSRDEEYRTLIPFLREGIEHGDQVMNIVDAAMRRDHVGRLEASGIHVNDAIDRDDLRILTSEETYMSGGVFSVERMYGTLQHALTDAKARNRRVRATGVMDWVERQVPGTERLGEYEARANFLVPTFDCTLLCIYDLSKLGGKTVMDVLATHPYVVLGQDVQKNAYYVPPTEFLERRLGADGARAETH